MIINPKDLSTELYPEIIEVVSRSDEAELIGHIKAAQDFVKSYLFKYDLKALFGSENSGPTVPDEMLKRVVIIIACYFLIRKARLGGHHQLMEDWQLWVGNSQDPGWLFDIKSGHINPDWPHAPQAADNSTEASQNEVYWNATKKRTNRF